MVNQSHPNHDTFSHRRTFKERLPPVGPQSFDHRICVLNFFSLQAGSLLVHVATESKSHVIRDQLYSVLRSVAQTEPGLTNQLVTDALVAFVCREEKPPAKPITEESERPVDYQIRLSSILSASSALPADTDLEVRKQILVNLVVLAHHKQICEFW